MPAATPKKCARLRHLHLFLIDEPDVRFVDQGCWLQRMTGCLPPHVARCHPSKVRVDDRHQVVERLAAAVAPGDQELRDICVVRGVVHHSPRVRIGETLATTRESAPADTSVASVR